MENFFKMLIYVTIKFFGNMLIGIAYFIFILPLLILVFEGAKAINPGYYILSVILGYIIGIIGSIIREDNEKNKPKS